MRVAGEAVWTPMLAAAVDIDVPAERQFVAWPTCEKRLTPSLNDLDFLSGHGEKRCLSIDKPLNFWRL